MKLWPTRSFVGGNRISLETYLSRHAQVFDRLTVAAFSGGNLYKFKDLQYGKLIRSTAELRALAKDVFGDVDQILDTHLVPKPRVTSVLQADVEGSVHSWLASFLGLVAFIMAVPFDQLATTVPAGLAFCSACSAGVIEAMLTLTRRRTETGRYVLPTRSIEVATEQGLGGKSTRVMLGHEYTHHLQRYFRVPYQRHQALIEGLSCAVEYRLAKKYSHDDLDYLKILTLQEAILLGHTYSVLARGRQICPSPEGEAITQWIKQDLLTSDYSLGYSVFRVAEEIHGQQIYRQAIRGDLSFLKS